jgi:uncharacterized delta-60 repeat protein
MRRLWLSVLLPLALASVATAQTVDPAFDPGANNRIMALAVQADGKVLIGGDFTLTGGGGSGAQSRSHLARLNPDGSVDGTFNPGANNTVFALAVQPDGKILVGGQFSRLGGGATTPRQSLGRLNADGSLDAAFAPSIGGLVSSIVIQDDGRILVGGAGVSRLNSDGSVDSSFHFAPAQLVYALALQRDGKILVGGFFTQLAGATRSYIGRLNPDGILDAGFDPGADLSVGVIAVQPDGKILLGGSFAHVGGGGTGSTARAGLARLNPDGTVDMPFAPSIDIGPRSFAIQADGRIVLGGWSSQTQSGIARLHADGSIDPAFTVPMSGSFLLPAVLALVVQRDGALVIGGQFDIVGGATRHNIARLTNTGAPVETLDISSANVINWTRDGTAPEVARVTMETSLDGITFTSLGDAKRVGNTWQAPNQALPFGSNVVIRARGYYQSGNANLSTSVVESIATASIPSPIAAQPSRLVFGVITAAGSAALPRQTPPQIVRLGPNPGGSISWIATPNQPWVRVSPSSGVGTGPLTISVDPSAGLPMAGTVHGSISLSISGAVTGVLSIDVTVNLFLNGTSSAPFGSFDTPLDNSAGVTGSMAVSGWALDDVAVTRVRVLRDAVAGETPGQVFIGNALLIDGARPDVVSAFPSVPLNSRGGWGYMLLTTFLPNQGDGTFKLYAYADDAEGHSALLGTKTITCANSTATRPFGAIDTPEQGAVASGASYLNFGWVLARAPALAYPPFGTVSVMIDGTPAGSPTGWTARSDLSAFFSASAYPGVTNAAGAATLDTTKLADGVHTIAWIVTADNGQSDGIGSRYFTVANGTSVVGSGSLAATVAHAARVELSAIERAPILVRRGYAAASPLRPYAPDARGRVTLQAEELDRIELRLGGPRAAGYLRTDAGLRPLPLGSHLDPATGVFTWQLGVGFLKRYDLVFLAGDARSTRQEVSIVVNPTNSGWSGTQVVVDLPAANAVVEAPFVVTGWAVDRDAARGTGIDALDVWAYPVAGGWPVFVGTAKYQGPRPDVGMLFGERFTPSGYGIVVDGLAPGPYDLAIFAWTSTRGAPVLGRTVRITVR